jgi:hypothetical protein
VARRKSQIRTFTSKGTTVPGYSGKGGGLIIGVRDPNTGLIIRGPRPAVDMGLKGGGKVRVTNPRAMEGPQARRYPTLGMGPVGEFRS